MAFEVFDWLPTRGSCRFVRNKGVDLPEAAKKELTQNPLFNAEWAIFAAEVWLEDLKTILYALALNGEEAFVFTAMKLEVLTISQTEIVEVIAEDWVIQNEADGLDLLGNIYYQGYDQVMVHARNITPEFFDLKTKLAGEILQKFATYRVRLMIIGDFSIYDSQSLKDFIFESNKGRHVHFFESKEEALRAIQENP